MSSFYDHSLTLYRDSLATPWGFRLEGGKDFHAPLTIQRVFSGSPASSDLQRGDILLSIQHRDAAHLLHNEANEIIRCCGGSLQLGIRRGHAYPNTAQYRPQASIHMSSLANYGYSQLDDPNSTHFRNANIEKIKDPKPILSQTGSPFLPSISSSRTSVKRYTQSSRTLPILSSSMIDNLPHTQFYDQFSRPPMAPQHPQTQLSYENTNFLATPYNDKRMVNQIQKSLNRVNTPHHVAHQEYVPPHSNHHVASSYFNNNNNFNFNGTGSYSSLPAPVTASQQHYSNYEPNRGPHYNQNLTQNNNQLPKVVNLQYNSPMGLYSANNVKEELFKKIGNQHQSQFAPSSEF